MFNGEIYNHRELRDTLLTRHGAQLATAGEAEVIVAAHDVWAGAAPQRLRGMFAYVIWDRRTGRVTGARDRFGIKPLYYLVTDDGLVVASEKKAILAFAEVEGLDASALSHYLTMQYVPEPATMHRRIVRLPAASTFDYTPGHSVLVERYWRARLAPARHADRDTVAGRIRHALRDSVRAHLAADVPVGAFLSGGIDSTGVVALAREVNPNIRTFSVGFAEPGYSELGVARESARALGLHTTEVLVTPADVMAELPRIVWHLDDPVADPALVPLYFLAREAARHVKVVLSGEGADELFGGYGIYREPLSLAPITSLPAQLRRGLAVASGHLPDGIRGKSMFERGAVDLAERYYGNARIFNDADKAILMRQHNPLVRHTNVTASLYAETAALDDVSTMQHIDLHTWLCGDILTKADRMTMAHGLELRVPFLDPVVFEIAASLPAAQKVTRHGLTKLALRRALGPLVPDGIAAQPKLGLPTPTRVWLRGELGEWVDAILAESRADEVLDLSYARSLLHTHRRGDADHSRKVWTVLIFCLWHAIFVEHSIPPPVHPPAPRAPSIEGASRR
jgi:asparagine synthase (glutamine-hydrolysing)